MTAGIDILFGFVEAGIAAQVLAIIPEFFWELSLGICLLLKAHSAMPRWPHRTKLREA